MRSLARGEAELEDHYHVSIYIVVYKLILGISEFLLGIAIALFGPQIYRSYQFILLSELSEDPHDLLARLSQAVVPNVLTHNTFVLVSLIVLGLAKIAGAIGLTYHQNWGVDLLVGLTVLMAPFQIIELILHPRAFDFAYLVVGLLIALYLVEFRPKAWVSRVLRFL